MRCIALCWIYAASECICVQLAYKLFFFFINLERIGSRASRMLRQDSLRLQDIRVAGLIDDVGNGKPRIKNSTARYSETKRYIQIMTLAISQTLLLRHSEPFAFVLTDIRKISVRESNAKLYNASYISYRSIANNRLRVSQHLLTSTHFRDGNFRHAFLLASRDLEARTLL